MVDERLGTVVVKMEVRSGGAVIGNGRGGGKERVK